MSKLYAYQISGETYIEGDVLSAWTKTIGVDVMTWTSSEIEGNIPFMVLRSGDTVPDRYVDISTIENWDKYGINHCNDYLVTKNAIKALVDEIGWDNLTDNERDISIKYYAYGDSTAAVIHLMTTKGYTQEQSQGYVLKKWHIHHGNVLKTCYVRWYYVKYIIPQYLNFADSEDLFDTGQQLIFEYIQMGRLGVDYGDNNDGLMDYLMSTNEYIGQGMEENNYTLLKGTWDEFREEIKKVLVEGIYEKHEINFYE